MYKRQTNNRYDDFDWSVFNIAGNFLFGIDFDNFDNHIYYLLNGSNSGYVDTGTTFTNGTAYSLQVTMDYAHNTWSATLNGTTTLVSNQPITVSSQNLDLGDICLLYTSRCV